MVIWSLPARDDLKVIHEYIAHDSPFYAQQVINNIIDKTEAITEFPETGRIVPEIKDNFRELFVYSYRIIYEISNDNIIVHAIIHGKRDLKKAFQNENEH